MSDMLAALRTDVVTLEKKDGTRYEEIRANHKAGLFSIYAGSVPVAIEDGDYLLHQLPHGATERYVITDHGFTSDFTGDQYNCAVRKTSAPPPTSPAHNVYVVTMSGSNSRLNIGSLDQSSNVIQVDSPRDLFAELRVALQSARDET